MQPSRRAFLQRAATGAFGAGAASSLLALSARAASQVQDALEGSRVGVPGRLRDQYDLEPHLHYFNHASIGTVPRVVREAYASYLKTCESNPWLHVWKDAWKPLVERVYGRVAAALGVERDEIALTRSTTEGFNILAQGLPLGNGDEVLFSSLNHIGASQCWHHQAGPRGFTVRQFSFPIREVSSLSAADVVRIHQEQIRAETRVLVLPHVDNLIDLRHPLRELAAMAHANGVEYVAVDAAQSVGMFPLDVSATGVDFFASSAHKWWQAPKELGVLYVARRWLDVLRPMIVTWGQTTWRGTARIHSDHGTHDWARVLALGHALDFQEQLGADQKERHLRARFDESRQRVEATAGWHWRSPNTWDLGASLYAIEIDGQQSTVLHERLWKNHRAVFRAFFLPELNSIRISPNLVHEPAELEWLWKTLAQECR